MQRASAWREGNGARLGEHGRRRATVASSDGALSGESSRVVTLEGSEPFQGAAQHRDVSAAQG